MNRNGFTLIEFLVYIAIGTIIVLFIGSFVISMFNARDKSRAVATVEEQGQNAMQIILQSIRNANAISVPTIGGSGSSVTLSFVSTTLNPTVFSLSSSTIFVSEAGGGNVAVTSYPVLASSLNFSNVTYSGGHGAVRVQFTLQYNNTNNRPEYQYQKTFYGTANLR